MAKITDFGLSDQILDQKSRSNNGGTYAYLDPRCFYDDFIKRDKKSDIFSFGVVLWEISSKKPPCNGLKDNNAIQIFRLNSKRDAPVLGTPKDYIELYSKCWNDDPEKRPSCEQ